VDAVGERVVAIADGHVRGRGLPRTVLDAPRAAELAQAAGFENLLNGRVVGQKTADGIMRVALDGNHCELEVPLGSVELGQAVEVAIRAGDILLANEAPRGLSARNILVGIVESVETRGAMVEVRVNAGVSFLVHVTLGAARTLEIKEGLNVWLIIKTYSCHVVSRKGT
jgi:molybdopterin-binding protein